MSAKPELDRLPNPDLLAETLLNGNNIDQRVKAARLLVKLGGPTVVDLLVKALDDSEPTFRAKLIKIVGQLNHPLRSELFVKAIKDTDCYVRKSAVESVIEVDHPQIIEALINRLRDEEINVRESAVIALEKSADRGRVVEVLTNALSDSHWSVRRESVEIIAKIGGPQAIGPLRRMLKDEDAEVRASALSGLAHHCGAEVIENAVEAFDDPDPSVRLEAFHITGKFGQPFIIARLEQIAAQENCSIMIRQAAHNAADRIRERFSE
ncbi:MAG TPA: HEAT repeat domain-containing protein [Blastocatellia bacterium]|nr:HEAT repeat domain-containing protein [Blastocatellia bacterium]